RRMEELRAAIDATPYVFNRQFLFRIMAMAHAQFAELIGARGPNTQVNAACSSTTRAVAVAEDWIRIGRCRRVVVVAADDITSDNMIGWLGAGFLSSGAAATGDVVEETALPFDRRRNGMIIGMGAAALVAESEDAARERGLRPICEVLGTKTLNSAFHRTRLDIQHISQLMEDLVAGVESSIGVSREQMASQMIFMSHETYTPARGGSAAAEVNALRRVFGDAADQIVIANTKGQTGHAMATGIEDVLAVKALETGLVPPVANFKEVDPELGTLNLSKGGGYPIEYAVPANSAMPIESPTRTPGKPGLARSLAIPPPTSKSSAAPCECAINAQRPAWRKSHKSPTMRQSSRLQNRRYQLSSQSESNRRAPLQQRGLKPKCPRRRPRQH